MSESVTSPDFRVVPAPAGERRAEPVTVPAPRRARLLLPALQLSLGVLDFLAVAGSFVAAIWLRNGVEVLDRPATFLGLAVANGLFWVLTFHFNGLYERDLFTRGFRQATPIGNAALAGAIFLIVAIFVLELTDPLRSRLMVLYFPLVAAAATFLLRTLVARPVLAGRFAEALGGATVIVGSDGRARRVAERLLAQSPVRPRVVGFVDDPQNLRRSPIPRDRILGGLEKIRELAAAGAINRVLITRSDLPREELVNLAHHCVSQNLEVQVVSNVFNVMLGRATVDEIDGIPIVEVKRTPLRGVNRLLKRAIDLAGATAGLVVLAPLFATIAVLVKLSSPGPVFYRQMRIGQGGREFTFYKFRSMVVDGNDEAHRRYLEALLREGAEAAVDTNGRKVYKLVDDPRITPVGRFLRRTSIDELPQLLNVVRGEMSLVGPRPCLDFEWNLYKDWQKRRLDVIPGLTGLWQVTGRSLVSFEEMVLLDLHYIANWSLALDLKLILKTLPVVISGRGGH